MMYAANFVFLEIDFVIVFVFGACPELRPFLIIILLPINLEQLVLVWSTFICDNRSDEKQFICDNRSDEKQPLIEHVL